MTQNESIYLEDDQIIITEDAPDHVHEWMEELGDDAEHVLNFLLLLVIDEKEPSEYDIVDANDLAESHREQMEQAVQDGDIEAAQKHKHLSEQYQERFNEFMALPPSSERSSAVKQVKETIEEIETSLGSNGAHIPLLKDKLDLDEETIDETIDHLKKHGEVYEPQTSHLRVT